MNRYYLSSAGYIVDSKDFYYPVWAQVKKIPNWQEVGAAICAELNAGADRLETHKKWKESLEKEFN